MQAGDALRALRVLRGRFLLEAPLSNEEQSKYAGGGRLLQRETRLTQNEPRLEAGLETVAVETAEPVLEVDTRPLERFGIGPHLEPDKSV